LLIVFPLLLAKNADEVSKVKGIVGGIAALKLSSAPIATASAKLIVTLCSDSAFPFSRSSPHLPWILLSAFSSEKRRKAVAEGGALKTALQAVAANSEVTEVVQAAIKALDEA